MLFQDKYPAIVEECISINKALNHQYSMNIEMEEVSFDQLIPFLFPTNDVINSKKLSRELRIYRTIIDNLNKGIVPSWIESISNDISIPLISIDTYGEINKCSRNYSLDIFHSYLLSTKRVFYRFLLLKKYRSIFDNNQYYFIYNAIKSASAFLLFDDDIFDLENDFKFEKKTILSDCLKNSNYNIEEAINKMCLSINTKSFKEYPIFSNYINLFISIYNE